MYADDIQIFTWGILLFHCALLLAYTFEQLYALLRAEKCNINKLFAAFVFWVSVFLIAHAVGSVSRAAHRAVMCVAVPHLVLTMTCPHLISNRSKQEKDHQ